MTYKQGTGSIAELVPVLKQANRTSDFSTWNETVLKLPLR